MPLNISYLPFMYCSEADPISGWSKPHHFHEDVMYAITLVNITLLHWNAKLNSNKSLFLNLEIISHDNAFVSYHPYEFSQRTLLAHFRMNNTNPPHSQFVQKPVYAAFGMLSRLGDLAADIMSISVDNRSLNILKTNADNGKPLYLSWLIMPTTSSSCIACEISTLSPQIHVCDKEVVVFIIEIIDQNQTNPVQVWRSFNSPPYPNATVRESMRRRQSLKLHDIGVLKRPEIPVDFTGLSYPWLMLLRVCSNLNEHPIKPQNLQITGITHNEVLATWEEVSTVSSRCLKTYEVWFRGNDKTEWLHISLGWHLPYPSFQFAPPNGVNVNGKSAII